MITVWKVPEMMCQHCEKAVKDALLALPGVKSVVVDLDKKTATVEHTETVAQEAVKKALDDVGYDASPEK